MRANETSPSLPEQKRLGSHAIRISWEAILLTDPPDPQAFASAPFLSVSLSATDHPAG
jgi:hypothetical protein